MFHNITVAAISVVLVVALFFLIRGLVGTVMTYEGSLNHFSKLVGGLVSAVVLLAVHVGIFAYGWSDVWIVWVVLLVYIVFVSWFGMRSYYMLQTQHMRDFRTKLREDFDR